MASWSTSSSVGAQAQGDSAVSVADLVSAKLRGGNEHNYESWKEQMLRLLERRGLLGFINGEAPPPPKNHSDYVAWRRTDWLVKGWILGALTDEVAGNVARRDSARDVWLVLENLFSTAQQAQCRPAINVANFVPSKLSRSSDWNKFKSWEERMLCLVETQGLVEFIDGNVPPSNNRDYNYSAGRQTDGVVKGWILEALSDEVAHSVVDLYSARDVWLGTVQSCTALSGDWDEARVILEKNPDAIKTRVSFTSETTLHIAVGAGKKSWRFVELSDDSTLSMKDGIGFNPLHTAAITGNRRAAEILIRRLPDLLYVLSNNGRLPHQLAAESGHRQTLDLLFSQSRDDLSVIHFAGEKGVRLLTRLVEAGFLDMALDLVDKYPHLARMTHPSYSGFSALNVIALKNTAFAGDAQLNLWERLLYFCIQLEVESQQVQSFDIENQEPPRWRKLHSILWVLISQQVPSVKRIYENKLMYEQALRLVKSICKHMESLGHERASAIYGDAMLTAARLGRHEIVEVIVGTFPAAIHFRHTATEQSYLHLAVRERSEKVFNLLYQTTNHRHYYSGDCDLDGNSILHLAAFLAPPHKLNLVPGAALQMQREIQWFEEVEKFASPANKGLSNHAGKTAAMIFTEQHRELKVEGEKWMKDTANSCTIAAALIVTMVFAAAITVPGGNESDSGYPVFSESSAFIIFAVSDAVSLFTSTTSLLMFLSILTSRYAEQDFLYALPKRLCIGLFTLFLSILSMMVAFSSTVYLVFGRKKAWVLAPVAAIALLPITSFVLLQFPLLFAVFSSTYGRGIFGKQSDRPFH